MGKEKTVFEEAKERGYSYGEYIGYLNTHNGEKPPKKNFGDRSTINFWWKNS